MAGARKKVLLVEDNYDNRAIYRAMLDHAGYEVIEAENGRDGVEAALAHSPAIILLDLSMPVQTGWDAISLLKADPQVSAVPVLALSAHVLLEGDYERAMAAGFSGYLTKPVEPKRVLRVVEDWIGPATGDAESPLRGPG